MCLTGWRTSELAPPYPEAVAIEPNERAFEIKLARAVAAGETQQAWVAIGTGALRSLTFRSLGRSGYRDLVERRLEAMDVNPSLRLLEQPQYKRRWAGASWETVVASAVREVILDQLEAPELWQDASGRRSSGQSPTLRHAAPRRARLREIARHPHRLSGFRPQR